MTLENFITRHATMDDLRGVVAMVRAYDAVIGFDFGDPTDDIHEVWTDSEFAFDKNTWLVTTPEGKVVGYMEYLYGGDEVELDGYIHPEYFGRGIGSYLLRYMDEQLHGSGKKAISTIPAADKRGQELYEGFGYHWDRGYWVMEIDVTELPVPKWPEGVELRPFDQARDARAAYDVVQNAFSWSRNGAPPEPFDDWSRRFERSDYDPELYLMAWKDDRIVGASLNLYRRPDLGWVRLLAVDETMRGKGLGMALLHQAFADFYRRGTPKVGLSVDSQNPTGATRLYQRVGMHIAEQYSSFAKQF